MTELKAGLELNALVAEEIMGWRRLSVLEDGAWNWWLEEPLTVSRMVEGYSEWRIAHTDDVSVFAPYYANECIPDYSTDIAEAWLVHQTACSWIFSKRKRYFEMLQEETRTDEGWTVAWPDALAILKDRMPEAICRAAIKTQLAPEFVEE